MAAPRAADPRPIGRGTNQEAVRRHNLGTVLRHVHGAGELSRADLTAVMELNRSTIAHLVSELETLGVVERTEPSARVGAGRPSAGVRVSSGGPYVVAVDLGVDQLEVAAVALGGTILTTAGAVIAGDTEPAHVAALLTRLAREVVADLPPDAPLVGVGIGVPGLVGRADGVIRMAPNLEWNDVAFADLVQTAFGLDVAISLANDANLGALAEHRRGAGVGVDDLVYISGHIGVGAGIISAGMPLGGVAGYAGEIGHLRYDPAGRPCHCGNRGCWETAVGAYAIAEAVGLPDSELTQLGDVLAGYAAPTDELRRIGAALGAGLAGLVNAFNPALVVLGGYLRVLYPLVSREVATALVEGALPAPLGAVRLTVPALGSDAVLLGAAEIAFEPLFADPVAALGAAVPNAGGQLVG